MNTKWTTWIVAGTVLSVLSSQVLAQPWQGGAGRRRGPDREQGMGMGTMADRPGPMRQGMGPGGPQGGPGTWGPFGAGQRGRTGWSPRGWGQVGLAGPFARRLGLTDDQVQKIRDILDKSRSKTMASIKEVLTEEQVRQLEQMRERAAQPSPRMRGPASQDGPGTPFQRGQGQGAQMGPRGQGPSGPPSFGGRGPGRGVRPQRGMNQSDAAVQPPAGGRGVGPAPSWNRGESPIEQRFDEADTNKDGALTREEIRAFHRTMGAGPGWQRP